MRLQRLSARDFTTLENPGVRSEQLVWPHNAPGAAVTITRVLMQPGATTPRHAHPDAEQTWVAERGVATLLLADGETAPVRAGEVIRTPPGEVHGLFNSGAEPFIYLTATAPAIDLTASYRKSSDRS